MIAARKSKEHSTRISMKTMSILSESGACFSPKQGMLGSKLLWTENKTKTKQSELKSKERDAPSIVHNIWIDKNIAWRRTNWWLLMKKGMHRGIPKLRHLSLLEYFLGVPRASPSLSSWHSWIFFHHLPSHTWKLPSYETHHKLIRVVSANNKLIPLGLCWKQRFSIVDTVSQDCQNFLQRKSLRKNCKTEEAQNRAESGKNRTAGSK